jgi:glucose-6-phosphate 1-dehydrogenase
MADETTTTIQADTEKAGVIETPCPRCGRLPSEKRSPCIMVIFGASGDLTRRKLVPALYDLDCDGLLDDHFKIIGFARSQKDHEQFRAELKDSVKEFAHPGKFSEEQWSTFALRLYYHTGKYDDRDSLLQLHQLLSDPEIGCYRGHYLYYLALPPDVAEKTLGVMRDAKCVPPPEEGIEPRIMIEKPFGSDLGSAKRMNRLVLDLFDESRVYRIDHYLAKDTVRNLLVFRFTNAIFESLWNRNYIDNIQITAAESIGIEGRGGYYDQAGVVKDMLQSHVMQVMALVAMEPPLAGDVESVRDKRNDIFKALAPLGKEDFVFGQYRGYREEDKVDPKSVTPTYAALRLHINNWRWQGVPFYLRSGKNLKQKITEVVIQFKSVPLCVLPNENMCPLVKPNTLSIRIQPDEGIKLSFMTQVPGREDRITATDLDFTYSEAGWRASEGYERVILDGLHGTPALFWRADGIEAAWRAVTPLIEGPPANLVDKFPNYEPGEWGPEEADRLLDRDNRYWISK